MSVEAYVTSSLRIAAEDLDAARALAAIRNRNAIYHCEQAAEKVIRAVLTSEGLHAGIKHHLNEMVDQIPDANPIKAALRSVQHLGAYATAFRYPTAVGKTPPGPAASALTDALTRVDAVLRDVAARFGLDLASPGGIASRVHPIR